MNKRNLHQKPVSISWIPLTTSVAFIVKKPLLFGWSLFLVLATIALTWLGFQLTTGFFDNLTKSFFTTAPATESIWGWIKYGGWQSSKWLFLLVSRILAFYLAFLTAYSLSAPLYAFLSTAAEKLYSGGAFEFDDGFSLKGSTQRSFGRDKNWSFRHYCNHDRPGYRVRSCDRSNLGFFALHLLLCLDVCRLPIIAQALDSWPETILDSTTWQSIFSPWHRTGSRKHDPDLKRVFNGPRFSPVHCPFNLEFLYHREEQIACSSIR